MSMPVCQGDPGDSASGYGLLLAFLLVLVMIGLSK